MHNKKITLISILIFAILLTACGGTDGDSPVVSDPEIVSSEALEPESDSVHVMNVTGRGSVSLDPDFVRISIGVQTEGDIAAEAVTLNSEQAQLIMDALDAFNISSNDIETTNFSVIPIQTRNSSGEVTTTTFRVQNTINITVDDIDSLGEILDAVVTAGANTIYGITFEVDPNDESSAYDQALSAAMQDARNQAIILAAAAGVELVDVISVSVSASPGVVNVFAERAFIDTAASVPISPGQNEVSVDVFVVYQIAAPVLVVEEEETAEPEATRAPTE
ncbi:MAG: DUF541 domain-containing protein [Chloroflexi bacterium]|nr:DUF541 domain-containing protein [Chloroflexota bacterium]